MQSNNSLIRRFFMIKDKLQNAENYYGISARLKAGFEWLKNNDMVNSWSIT